MIEKKTDELNNVLGNMHASDIGKYLSQNNGEMLDDENMFSVYIKDIIKRNGLLLQEVFLYADVPERYGYKLLSGEKHTKQRDVILRICYSAKLTLEETQKALKIYGMPTLYARKSRDAALMICFNDRPGSIIDVNAQLKKNNLEPLRASGVQD